MQFAIFTVIDVFGTNVQDNGLISAIPAGVGCLGLIIAAVLSDYLRNRGTFNKPLVS